MGNGAAWVAESEESEEAESVKPVIDDIIEVPPDGFSMAKES
jgi:hypothetical protein